MPQLYIDPATGTIHNRDPGNGRPVARTDAGSPRLAAAPAYEVSFWRKAAYWLISLLLAAGIGYLLSFPLRPVISTLAFALNDFLFDVPMVILALGPWCLVAGSVAASLLFGLKWAGTYDYNLWAYALSFLSSALGSVCAPVIAGVIILVVMLVAVLAMLAFMIAVVVFIISIIES